MLDKHLHKNRYWYGREWPKKNITPRVIVEEYLENDDNELTDYKIHCFNGVPKLILDSQGRFKESKLCEDFLMKTGII